jgi:hypothetical protein
MKVLKFRTRFYFKVLSFTTVKHTQKKGDYLLIQTNVFELWQGIYFCSHYSKMSNRKKEEEELFCF